MHSSYKNPILKQLRDQQVRYTPRDKKVEQVNRCERLLAELDPQRVYPSDYLVFRITDYRPSLDSPARISGQEAAHDLRLLVEDLSEAAAVPADGAGEKVLTVEELSDAFNVSTKTISRWRQQGLISRRFVFDGRSRVGFLQSSVDQFVSRNEDKVRRGAKFSQMSEVERTEIIDRARRLSRAGACPSQVAQRIAKRLGRSVETIRYTLKQFDESHPEMAVFPRHMMVLNDAVKERIYQQFRRGISVEKIAQDMCRTRNSVYRIVNEIRANKLLEVPVDFMPSEEFTEPNADEMILGPMPAGPETSAKKPRLPSGLPPYLASLYDVPLLTREQERHLFRRFNYLKFRACGLRMTLDPAKARSTVLDELEDLQQQIVATKNEIVRANLRLVVSIAKRHVGHGEGFFELISDGNMSLIRAVEKFDYTRGNKFSTYASWAIMKNFARTIPDEIKHRDRFRTTSGEVFLSTEETRSDQFGQEHAQQVRESQINRILGRLDEREQKIIISRFGLDHHQEPLTLKEVGVEMGVTKERVRQIEARALEKLRVAVQEEKLDVPMN